MYLARKCNGEKELSIDKPAITIKCHLFSAREECLGNFNDYLLKIGFLTHIIFMGWKYRLSILTAVMHVVQSVHFYAL